MMILQTDVHNPKVKFKMKLADFAKMTMSFEYLTAIFQRDRVETGKPF